MPHLSKDKLKERLYIYLTSVDDVQNLLLCHHPSDPETGVESENCKEGKLEILQTKQQVILRPATAQQVPSSRKLTNHDDNHSVHEDVSLGVDESSLSRYIIIAVHYSAD